jgi:hypothetical protein
MKIPQTLIAAAIAFGFAPIAGAASLILNGSFETSTGAAPNETFGFPNDVLVTYPGPPGAGSIDNWTLGLGSGWSEFYWYWGAVTNQSAQDGSRFMNLTSTSGQATLESISQSFTVAAGQTYTVSYYSRERAIGADIASTISLGAGSATGTLSQVANVGATWTQFSYSFTPDTSTTATLSFTQSATGAGLDNGVFLDNVSVIPEPSALALCGLAGLGLLRRRR